MDSSYFDTLVRSLAGAGSRRTLSRTGFGVVGAALLSAVGLSGLGGAAVTAKGKNGKGKGGGKSKGKGKGKGKKKGGCARKQQVAGQDADCAAPVDLGSCADEEERQHGLEHAGQCRSRYMGYCDLIPEANECSAFLTNCCKYYETCDHSLLQDCVQDGFGLFPELCQYVSVPGACL